MIGGVRPECRRRAADRSTVGPPATNKYSRLSSANGPPGEPADSASTSRPATSTRPSHRSWSPSTGWRWLRRHTWRQESGGPLKDGATVSPRGQVQQRPERAVHHGQAVARVKDAHVLLMPKTLATATVDPHHPHSTTRRSPSYARQPPCLDAHAQVRSDSEYQAARMAYRSPPGTVSSPGHDLDRCGALLGSPTRARSSSATRAVDAVPSRAIAPYLSICASNTVRPSRISCRPASLRPGG